MQRRGLGATLRAGLRLRGGGGRGRPRVRTSLGALDICLPSFLSGWCIDAAIAPSPVDVLVNGTHLARVAPNLRREDLVSLGFHPDAGFAFTLPEPLTLDDVVEVHAADGRPLWNSPSTHHRQRLSRLLDGIEPATMSGLEIGALDRPTLSKRGGDVRYVDHASTEALRAKYAGQGLELVDPDRIVSVDYVWAGGPLAAIVPEGELFDYCIAVQVMEHVADPIGWLQSLAEVLRPGGILALALPERSLCFDYRRETTRPSDLIEAYLLKLDRPNIRQVFDHFAFASPILRRAQGLPPYDATTLGDALALARTVAEQGTYADVHCNVFTVEAFRQCWDVIDRMDLLPLDLAALHEPYPDGDEFIVSFRRR